jgi:hypothetical protein
VFKGFSKLLICGGYNPDIDTCEVINLASIALTCKNPPIFPAKVYRAIGGLGFKGNPIICGGDQNDQNDTYSNKCYSLENNEWVSSAGMNSVRVGAAAAKLKDGKLLVTGGYVSYSSSLKGAEILTEDGWESNIPSLPVTIYGHCMVTVNSTTVMVIGGQQNDQFSGKTFYFTFGEESWTEGPELKNKRRWHSCGKIRRNKESQEMSIIVAGGYYDGNLLSSVEIMDEGSNEWQTGPELPFRITDSKMVEDQNGGVVLIGGRSESIRNLDTLYQLPHGGLDAVWTKMEQKMKTGRYSHTAFLIPDNFVDCS